MTTNVKYEPGREARLKSERAAKLKAATVIVDRAKASGRELRGSENDEVQAAFNRIDDLDVEIVAQSKAMVDSVMSLGNCEMDPDVEPGRSVFSEGDAKGLVAAVKSKGLFRTTEVSTKAALTGAVVPTSGQGVEPGLFPNAFPLATLFRTEVAAGPSVRYYTLGGATAGVVAEGGTKPDAGLEITAKDVLVEKIATTVRFTDEFSEDAAFLLSFLQQELTSAVVTKENAEILSTLDGTSGVLTGTGAATTVIDLIADAIAGQQAINGSSPSAVVVNPTTLATIRKAKASTGGDYFVDPLSGKLTAIHGVQVVSTPATGPGTAWVVNAAGVVIYRRGGITAEIGWNADDWQSNQRTMRVEERFATAVVRPSMLTKLTLTSS